MTTENEINNKKASRGSAVKSAFRSRGFSGSRGRDIDSFAQLEVLVQALIVVMGWTGSDVDDVVSLGGSKGQLPQQLRRLLESITHTARSHSLLNKKKLFDFEKFEAVTILRVCLAMRSTQCNRACYSVDAWRRLAHN